MFATPFECIADPRTFKDLLALLKVEAGHVSAMSDKNTLAEEKRDVARRARRLAQSLLDDADRARLTQFADELDKEAAALAQSVANFVLPPHAAPHRQVQQQQVQQQQSAESPVQPPAPRRTD